jgi:hypothetical protein
MRLKEIRLSVCSLFNNAAYNSDHIASNGLMTEYNAMEAIWKKAVVA